MSFNLNKQIQLDYYMPLARTFALNSSAEEYFRFRRYGQNIVPAASTGSTVTSGTASAIASLVVLAQAVGSTITTGAATTKAIILARATGSTITSGTAASAVRFIYDALIHFKISNQVDGEFKISNVISRLFRLRKGGL